MSGGYRLDQGGRINRARPVSFRLDGHHMQGFDGDSLASALVANGVRIVARSTRLRRPRGIMALGPEDPDGLFRVRDGHGSDPCARAGLVPLVEGMEAETLSGRAGPRLDPLAPVQALAGFLSAGFYCKTFKWPGWSWYEGAIWSMTGHGSVEAAPDPRRREMRHDSCDVLVIGAGPAGLAAARALAGAGRRVLLADARPQAGGSLLWEETRIDGQPGIDWAASVVAGLCANGHRWLPDTTATGAYEGGMFTLLQALRDDRGLVGERIWKLRARAVVLATGAHDRPMPFADNDRPGIFLARAVRGSSGATAWRLAGGLRS